MSHNELSKAAAAERLGVSPKQIERYVHAGMPCTGTGRARRFPWPEIRRWRDDLLQKQALERIAATRPSGLQAAKARREAALADLAELARDEKLRQLMPVEMYEEALEGICMRLRAVCTGTLESFRREVAPEVLERIGDMLIAAMRGAGDDEEEKALADDPAAPVPPPVPPGGA